MILGIETEGSEVTVSDTYSKNNLLEMRLNRLVLNLFRIPGFFLAPSVTASNVVSLGNLLTPNKHFEIIGSMKCPTNFISAIEEIKRNPNAVRDKKKVMVIKQAFIEFLTKIETDTNANQKEKLEKLRQLLTFVISFEQSSAFSYFGYEMRRNLQVKSLLIANFNKDLLAEYQLSTHEIFSVIDLKYLPKNLFSCTDLKDPLIVDDHISSFSDPYSAYKWSNMQNINTFVFALLEKIGTKKEDKYDYSLVVVDGKLWEEKGISDQVPSSQKIHSTLLHPERVLELNKISLSYLVNINNLLKDLEVEDCSVCFRGIKPTDPIIQRILAIQFGVYPNEENWTKGIIELNAITSFCNKALEGESSAELLYLYFEIEKEASQLPTTTFHFLPESFAYDLEFYLARQKEVNRIRKQLIFDFVDLEQHIPKKRVEEILENICKIICDFPNIERYFLYAKTQDQPITVILEVEKEKISLYQKRFWDQYKGLNLKKLSQQAQGLIQKQLQGNEIIDKQLSLTENLESKTEVMQDPNENCFSPIEVRVKSDLGAEEQLPIYISDQTIEVVYEVDLSKKSEEDPIKNQLEDWEVIQDDRWEEI